jgi:hypothetical protein
MQPKVLRIDDQTLEQPRETAAEGFRRRCRPRTPTP